VGAGGKIVSRWAFERRRPTEGGKEIGHFSRQPKRSSGGFALSRHDRGAYSLLTSTFRVDRQSKTSFFRNENRFSPVPLLSRLRSGKPAFTAEADSTGADHLTNDWPGQARRQNYFCGYGGGEGRRWGSERMRKVWEGLGISLRWAGDWAVRLGPSAGLHWGWLVIGL